MTLPATIKVGSQVYRVCVEEPWIEDQYGGCDTKGLRIWLSDHTCPARQAKTLVHEIIEALNFEYDMDLEHHQIELLEAGLYGVLRDNPRLGEGVNL